MAIAVEVPGLDQFVQEIPDGRLLLLEGGLAPAKNHLARHLGQTASRAGRPVTLVSTRTEAKAKQEALRLLEVEEWPDLASEVGRDLVIDSFSLLAMDQKPSEVAERLRRLRHACAQKGSVAVLVLDDGQLDAQAQAVCHHLADGVIQFRIREDPEGPVAFLRVPKWMDRQAVERNIYYGFDGRNLLIDTRRRVN
jgi:KaiC/GvpD/RAD55 family RecA-like ATPase